MFKRANKMTALLVAAASVMSLVPAMAADTTKLTTQDGTIEKAIAFSDGKYVFEGYKSDDEDQSVYYNDGKEDKELSDVQDADLNAAYGDKYAFANDSSDQYLVDLSNGDVVDDQTPDDDISNAATKLKTKLKKTDRYGDKITLGEENLYFTDKADDTLETLPGSKFGDAWYSYKVKVDKDTNTVAVGSDNYLFGFTDSSAKYIDASNLANIYAYSSKKGKVVKIEEFSNDKGDVDDETGLLATLLAQPVVLTQDEDNIYTLVKVAVTDASGFANSADGATTVAASTVSEGIDAKAVTTVRYYVQKISKEQGDQKDDAYIPKTVESYEVGNKDGKEFDCGDAKDAYSAFADIFGSDMKISQDGTMDENKVKFTICDDELTAIYFDGTKNIKATSFKFKKDKVKYETNSLPISKTEGKKFGTDDKADIYMVEKDDSDDVDIDKDLGTTKAAGAYDVDAKGNIWLIADGKIYKFSKNEFTKVYSVDSSLNQISVYDDNNLVAWEDGGDIFATVGGASAAKEEKKAEENKKETEKSTTAQAVTPAKTGWDQLANGSWNFYDATGTKVVSNWVNVGGVWYYLKADGVMATGWLNDKGTWYYLNGSGAMQTGWVNDNGTWYYCNASGAMLASTTVDGYVLGANGAWVR